MAAESAATAPRVRLIGGMDGALTGLSRYARSLYAALVAEGVTPDVAAPSPSPLPAPAVAAARRMGFDLRAFFSTYAVALPQAPAGMVTHLTAQGHAGALAFGSHGPTVVTVHDLITMAHRDDPELTGHMKPYDHLFERLVRRGLLHADRLIAVSTHTKQDIIRFTGCPADRITVVLEGIDHTTFIPAPVPEEFFARYGLQPETPTVLYVGSEDPRKNLRRLLAAFAGVRETVPDAVLIKVGAARFAAERGELLAAADTLRLTGSVRFFDQVPDGDLAHFYRAATVLAFPSLYEGFGLPALEAMACGTPVVCSDATSLPEVVGGAGLLVPPTDVKGLEAALRRVLTDSDLRASLRERGLARAAEFTWQRAARGTLKVYQAALAAHQERR